MGQHIRLSQFVLNYGPGAIIESTAGPRLILSFERGLFNWRRINGDRYLRPEDFEINCQVFTQSLKPGVRIFRVPSNASLNIDEGTDLYNTVYFQKWELCTRCGILYKTRCPRICGENNCKDSDPRRAIRFIRACPAGHLDDIDWDYAVHHQRKRCSSEWFYWQRKGPRLKDVLLKCPLCGIETTLGNIYSTDMPCSGRLPESDTRVNCDKRMRAIQRQATNLRVAETVSLFTVPPRHTALHKHLENTTIFSSIVTHSLSSKNDLEKILSALATRSLITETTKGEILKYDWEIIKKAIEDVTGPVAVDYRDMLIKEFNRLIDASIHGVFPGNPNEPDYLFEVVKSKIRKIKTPNNRIFRVVPVSRLNAVIVQLGYKRFTVSDPKEIKLVDITYKNSSGKWLPGVEVPGEGIFLMLDGNDGWHFKMEGKIHRKWYNVYQNSNEEYSANLFRCENAKDELHPVFVWWHTLAHAINRAISIDSGYSAAAIRERVYIEINRKGYARGGILLYTVQPGSDGTLGGLISLVPHFETILSRAAENIENCSNDPVCGETVFAPGRSTGAACYACSLISETSCEHRNLWLDRKILLENMP
jgi:hypothetical protein